ncbi:multidrug transporter subunit MdtN [Ancylobacter dichloromethanicus]|uniref:Multidrug resistance protein MdtN n=1 Tax=Ancylobacter dichloromethanicus TaxID=518825 RepID=A0A9W6J5D1_9HYPH|nr:multidrug transporter subunit MdtN [Ancylobacter dichloromethanicus]MBS7554074.1 multidrug transporter subunit MdtN [Ancylobacter dichloromethanicus]GLK71190.1 multidrug resistance protein MdtN [Ancylobacter dichloromethanicus]
MDTQDHPGPQRRLAIVVSLLAVLAAGFLGWEYIRNAELNPLSQDAELTADVTAISASVPGRIVAIGVRENDAVRKGELLFALDPATYRLQVEQAKADLRLAEATLGDKQRTVTAERANAVIAQDQVTRARQNLELATQTLGRLEALRPKGYVSAQQVDDAATAKRDAQVSLRQAMQQEAAAVALVSDTAAAVALVEARRAALAIAERALNDTQVTAPFDGKVVGLETAVGEYVLPGQSIFVLIDTGAWYASAAFIETELARLRVGNCASVYTLADREVKMRGRVEGISWGVQSTEQISLPRKMPIVPKSLDWVRVAQRFPVRIRLIDPPSDLMRIGASATAIVHHDTDC